MDTWIKLLFMMIFPPFLGEARGDCKLKTIKKRYKI